MMSFTAWATVVVPGEEKYQEWLAPSQAGTGWGPATFIVRDSLVFVPAVGDMIHLVSPFAYGGEVLHLPWNEVAVPVGIATPTVPFETVAAPKAVMVSFAAMVPTLVVFLKPLEPTVPELWIPDL